METLPNVLKNALEWVRLAPSAGNKQPWRLVYNSDENRVDFFIDRGKTKKNGLYWRLNFLDIGITMAHFELAYLDAKILGDWKDYATNLKYPYEFPYEYVISWIFK